MLRRGGHWGRACAGQNRWQYGAKDVEKQGARAAPTTHDPHSAREENQRGGRGHTGVEMQPSPRPLARSGDQRAAGKETSASVGSGSADPEHGRGRGAERGVGREAREGTRGGGGGKGRRGVGAHSHHQSQSPPPTSILTLHLVTYWFVRSCSRVCRVASHVVASTTGPVSRSQAPSKPVRLSATPVRSNLVWAVLFFGGDCAAPRLLTLPPHPQHHPRLAPRLDTTPRPSIHTIVVVVKPPLVDPDPPRPKVRPIKGPLARHHDSVSDTSSGRRSEVSP